MRYLLALGLAAGCTGPTPCAQSTRLVVDCPPLSGTWRVTWEMGQLPACAIPPPRPDTWSMGEGGFGQVQVQLEDTWLTGTQYEDHRLILSGASESLGTVLLDARLTTPAFADGGFIATTAAGSLRVSPNGSCSFVDGFKAERLTGL